MNLAWVDQLLAAAKSQTAVVAGAEPAAELVAELAEELYRVIERRGRLCRVEAHIGTIAALAVAQDGTLYLVDETLHRVRRVGLRRHHP